MPEVRRLRVGKYRIGLAERHLSLALPHRLIVFLLLQQAGLECGISHDAMLDLRLTSALFLIVTAKVVPVNHQWARLAEPGGHLFVHRRRLADTSPAVKLLLIGHGWRAVQGLIRPRSSVQISCVLLLQIWSEPLTATERATASARDTDQTSVLTAE